MIDALIKRFSEMDAILLIIGSNDLNSYCVNESIYSDNTDQNKFMFWKLLNSFKMMK
jgi:hypothetical protein